MREHVFVVWDKVGGHLGPALASEAWNTMVDPRIRKKAVMISKRASVLAYN